jgi:hypothetical protein
MKIFFVLAIALMIEMPMHAGRAHDNLEQQIVQTGRVIQKASLLHDKSKRYRHKASKSAEMRAKSLEILSGVFKGFANNYIDDEAIRDAIAYMYKRGDIAPIVEAFHFVADEKMKEIDELEVASSFFDDESNCQVIYPILHRDDWRSEYVGNSSRYATLEDEETARSEVEEARAQKTGRFMEAFGFSTAKIERL